MLAVFVSAAPARQCVLVVAEAGHPAHSSTAAATRTASSTARTATAAVTAKTAARTTTFAAGLGTAVAQMYCLERNRGVESCWLLGGRSELRA